MPRITSWQELVAPRQASQVQTPAQTQAVGGYDPTGTIVSTGVKALTNSGLFSGSAIPGEGQVLQAGVQPSGAVTYGTAPQGPGWGETAANAGGLFTGNSIGTGIENTAASLWQGPLGDVPVVGDALFDASFSASAMPNWAYGVAGIGGGFVGNAIGGPVGGIAGSLGSTAGMALGGPIGAIAGSVLGGLFGSLFEDDDETVWTSGQSTFGAPDGKIFGKQIGLEGPSVKLNQDQETGGFGIEYSMYDSPAGRFGMGVHNGPFDSPEKAAVLAEMVQNLGRIENRIINTMVDDMDSFRANLGDKIEPFEIRDGEKWKGQLEASINQRFESILTAIDPQMGEDFKAKNPTLDNVELVLEEVTGSTAAGRFDGVSQSLREATL